MAADLTSVDAALKETWTESRLAEQLYQKNPLLDKVKKLKSTQVGQQAVTPIHTGRNWGYTATPANAGTLNAAGQQEIKQATWQYTHHHSQVRIEGSAIDGTRGDALSVAEVVDMEVEGALNDLNRQLTRQLFMDGDGLIAQCGTTTASTTVALNATSGFNALERGWIAPGSVVDIGTTGDGDVIAAGRTVTAVTESTSAPTIVISGATVTTSASHYVSLQNSRSATTGATYEMNGLGNIVSSSASLGGLSVASVPTWASPSVDSTSQALTLPLMYTACRKVFQKTGNDPNYVATSPKQLQAAYALAQAQVRFHSDNVSFGNVEGTDINGMKLYRHPDCKNEDMFFLTVEDLLLVSAGDPFWQNKVAGANILNWIQGTDQYGAKITVRLNLGARRRNSHSALRGLT
jgi:hypothetical protein